MSPSSSHDEDRSARRCVARSPVNPQPRISPGPLLPNPHVTRAPFPEFLHRGQPLSLALHPSTLQGASPLRNEKRSAGRRALSYHKAPAPPAPICVHPHPLPVCLWRTRPALVVAWTSPPRDEAPLSCIVIFSHSVDHSHHPPALRLPLHCRFLLPFPARTSPTLIYTRSSLPQPSSRFLPSVCHCSGSCRHGPDPDLFTALVCVTWLPTPTFLKHFFCLASVLPGFCRCLPSRLAGPSRSSLLPPCPVCQSVCPGPFPSTYIFSPCGLIRPAGFICHPMPATPKSPSPPWGIRLPPEAPPGGSPPGEGREGC